MDTAKNKMPVEDKAYTKMGLAMTETQRRKWNILLLEMRALSNSVLDPSQYPGNQNKATRLHALISQLPIFDKDGRGFHRTGPAIMDF